MSNSNLKDVAEQANRERLRMLEMAEAFAGIQVACEKANAVWDKHAGNNGHTVSAAGSAASTTEVAVPAQPKRGRPKKGQATIVDAIRAALKSGPLYAGEIRRATGMTPKQMPSIYGLVKSGALKSRKTPNGQLFSLAK